MELSVPANLNVTAGQWDDFLLRQFDPCMFAKYQVLLKNIRSVQGRSILVVGSGSGEFAALLARAGATVSAIDIDQAAIDLTVQTAQRFGVQIAASVARLEEFSPAEKFDLVVATDVIEHIEDDHAAVQKLHSLCISGGRVVITVPALQSLYGYLDKSLGHFRRYSRRQLNELIGPYFKIEFERYFGLFLVPVAWVISRFLQRPYPVAAVGKAEQSSVNPLGMLIRWFFWIEKAISPPIGISLLLIGRVK